MIISSYPQRLYRISNIIALVSAIVVTMSCAVESTSDLQTQSNSSTRDFDIVGSITKHIWDLRGNAESLRALFYEDMYARAVTFLDEEHGIVIKNSASNIDHVSQLVRNINLSNLSETATEVVQHIGPLAATTLPVGLGPAEIDQFREELEANDIPYDPNALLFAPHFSARNTRMLVSAGSSQEHFESSDGSYPKKFGIITGISWIEPFLSSFTLSLQDRLSILPQLAIMVIDSEDNSLSHYTIQGDSDHVQLVRTYDRNSLKELEQWLEANFLKPLVHPMAELFMSRSAFSWITDLERHGSPDCVECFQPAIDRSKRGINTFAFMLTCALSAAALGLIATTATSFLRLYQVASIVGGITTLGSLFAAIILVFTYWVTRGTTSAQYSHFRDRTCANVCTDADFGH